MTLLAFIPLYDPLPALFPGMSDHWLILALPLVIAISVVYKGTRIPDGATLRTLPREAAIMSVQILLVMAIAMLLLAAGYWTFLHFGWTNPS